MNDTLQWLGFAGIVLGAFFYVRRPMWGATFSFLGCALLTLWCAIQDPIPLGVLCVQVVCAGISLINFQNANTKSSAWGDGVD